MITSDPFTRTPGIAGDAYINMHYADSIIGLLQADNSSKYIFKILGLRGSGKSVEYRQIMNRMAKEEGWLVYMLSAAGDPTSTLISMISKEPFIDENDHTIEISAEGSGSVGLPIIGGSASVSVSRTSTRNHDYYSQEAVLTEMIETANRKNYKILIGIDDVAKTPEIVRFLSICGTLIMKEDIKLYLVCTGLYQNIEDVSKAPALTFFRRGDSVEIGNLDIFSVSAMYQKLLSVDEKRSVELAKLTNGYAYAYQVLGSLYYNQNEPKDIYSLMPDYERILFRDSYELLWESLTNTEQEFVRAAATTTGAASEIKQQMTHSSGYSSIRARLEGKRIINTKTRGQIKFDLPCFDKYVRLWQT